MFKVGDYVVLKDIAINDNIILKKNVRYKINKIVNIKGDLIYDFYLEGYPNRAFYHERFELDLSYNRSEKVKKINKNV